MRVLLGIVGLALVLRTLTGCTININIPATTAAKPAARPAAPVPGIPPGAVPGAPVNDPLHLNTRKIA
jgi:hypothetical protein